ncbi:MAG: GerMN domain-containing protein [Patescibacteria group bacterium]|nr:GerMN domain-containing protein [Patescibacteria group bacterium]
MSNKNKTLIFIGIILVIVFIFMSKDQIFKTLPIQPAPAENSTPTPPLVSQVKIFLTALEDSGNSGLKIGCGDSLIPVTVDITPTTKPLTQALNELLSLKQQYYGESGLYNALYNSDLKLDSATVENGVAEIYISGNLSLGGVCDDPRVQAQLEQTALQFPTVKEVKIYINNIPLSEVLSEK